MAQEPSPAARGRGGDAGGSNRAADHGAIALGYHCLIPGKDRAAATHPSPTPSKIIMFHGWLSSHEMWLKTAQGLSDRYGHSVLLFDFYGHGRSEYPPRHTDLTLDAYVEQARALSAHYGWGDCKLTLCGCSAGGAACCLFALKYPERVQRLVLVAAAGLSEPDWWDLQRPTYPMRFQKRFLQPVFAWLERSTGRLGALMERGSRLWKFAAQLYFVQDSPTYLLPEDLPDQLRRLPLALVWGTEDTIHTAQIARWKAGREDVSVLRLEGAGHGDVGRVGGLDKFDLHMYTHWWHEAPRPDPCELTIQYHYTH